MSGSLLMEESDRSTARQPLGKVADMKHLLTGVALAALLGFAPLAMAQTATPGASGTTGTMPSTGAPSSGMTRGGAMGTTPGGTTSGSMGSGSMGSGSMGSGSMGATSGSSTDETMTKSGRKGTGATTSRSSRGRDADMTRQLNEQELNRLRGG
jgi:hypothetical protein